MIFAFLKELVSNKAIVFHVLNFYWFMTGILFFVHEPKGMLKKTGIFLFCISLLCSILLPIENKIMALVLGSLAITCLYDYVEYYIPRFCSLFFLPISFLATYFNLIDEVSFASSVASSCGAAFLFFLIAKIFEYRYGFSGMGTGDIEFVAMLGSILGINFIAPTVTIACFIGALFFYFNSTTNAIPFGSALAIATVHVLLIKHFYARLLSSVYLFS